MPRFQFCKIGKRNVDGIKRANNYARQIFGDPVADSEEQDFRSTAVPLKTRACTEWGLKVWSDWSKARAATNVHNAGGASGNSPIPVSPSTPLLEMPAEDLAYWLGKFVLEVRKKNGDYYPPKTIYALVCCFKRFYEQNGIHTFLVS